MINKPIDDESWVGKNTLPPEDRGWITTIKSNTNNPDLLVDRPNWDYWSRIAKLRLSQATRLSLNIAPGAMPESPADTRCEELWRECTRRSFIVLNHIDSFEILERTQHPLDSFIDARTFAAWAEGLGYILPLRFPGATIKPKGTEHESPVESQGVPGAAVEVLDKVKQQEDRRLARFRVLGGEIYRKDGKYFLRGKGGPKEQLMVEEARDKKPRHDGKAIKADLITAFERERMAIISGQIRKK